MGRFIIALKKHFRGYDLGLHVSPHIVGNLPLRKNRKERRSEAKRIKQRAF